MASSLLHGKKFNCQEYETCFKVCRILSIYSFLIEKLITITRLKIVFTSLTPAVIRLKLSLHTVTVPDVILTISSFRCDL